MAYGQYIYVYVVSLSLFLIIDFIWLGVVASSFYKTQLGHLLAGSVNWLAVVGVYLILAAGVTVFVISPALEARSITQALLGGLFFGLVAYAVYDLTNLATLKNWPLLVTVVDIAWGAIICGLVATFTYLLAMMYIIK